MGRKTTRVILVTDRMGVMQEHDAHDESVVRHALADTF